METGLTDEALMARVAVGDRTAFRALLARHQTSVYRLAFRHLGQAQDAEDVAQETFARLYEAAARYRPTASFRTYLLTIASRLCLNRRARFSTGRELSHGPAELEALGQAARGTPEGELLMRERTTAVRRAIEALPGDQRMALSLFRFEELSCEEIGKVMGKSVSSVTSLLWRAREQLRHKLAEWGRGESEAVRNDLALGRLNRLRKVEP